MKTILTIILLFISLITFSQTQPKDTTNPIQPFCNQARGLTRELAIPIDSRTEYEGLPLERRWIRTHYHNSKVLDFNMEGNGEDDPTELYDIYLIKTARNTYLRIYFKVLYFNVNI